MSSNKKCVYLDEVKPWKWTWLINVKVLHTWKPSFTGFGESMEIIFADKKGFKIQATCKNNYMKSLGDECIVGEWKTVENFQVSPAGKTFRPTNNIHKITFIKQTIIKTSDVENDDMFLALASFDSVLADIIGQAIDVSELQTLNCVGKERKKIEFNLRDINDQRIACCLWGKFAEIMDSHREEAQFGVVVCLLRFAKLGSFRGKIQVSNAYDSSQLIFDPNIKEVEELKEMFKLNGDNLSMVETSEEGKQLSLPNVQKKMDTWNQTEDITVSELLNSTQIGKCKVVATIYAIDTNYAWFKLHLKVKDDTAETKLLLLDWIASPLLGVKAEKILDGSLEELEDPEMLPPCIIDIVGKTFKFGVDVVKDNISKGYEIYKVLKVWSVYNTLMVDSQSDAIIETGASTHSVSEGSLLTYSDESSGLAKTPSKRSQYELGDLTDTNSTSKTRPTKIIKVEKMSNEELSLKKSDYRNK
ncbi:uncharacterized protein LOC130512568 [Raphanus sativus]|uniref:Uncharacterized protein LOC130512568 n=1 Tax=Raphanus sativus TaxID=3726 RepID=A0A9W3DS48_RAPSA|nr:uncharacterized protein LOC130512568 [Raphanus sativus]